MTKYIAIIILSLFISCTSQKENSDKRIIPVAEVIGTGEILNLSNCAKSVRYIPLETNDTTLIAGISSIYKLGEMFLVQDYRRGATSPCFLYDKHGKYIRQIGKKGPGPDEYTLIRSVDVRPNTNTIFMDVNTKCMEYDTNGNMTKHIRMPECPDKMTIWESVQINDSIYLSTLTSSLHRHYKALLFNMEGKTTMLYPNHLGRIKNERGWGSSDGKYYRFKDQIRLWRSWDDTIFTINKKLEPEVTYIFDMGPYKAPMEWMESYRTDYDRTNYVFPYAIKESSKYLFLNFQCGQNAPEKYEYEITSTSPGMQQKRTLVNVDVFGLFNKSTGKLTLLNQPVKHKYLGFRNDLDGGPCFWPIYISPDEEMVTWFSADKFLEIYETLPNPSPELKALAEKLIPDDNPVLMIVQLK